MSFFRFTFFLHLIPRLAAWKRRMFHKTVIKKSRGIESMTRPLKARLPLQWDGIVNINFFFLKKKEKNK